MNHHQTGSGAYGPNSGKRASTPATVQASGGGAGHNTPNAYLKTKVMSASPAELRLLLIEGAIRFCDQARSGISESNPEMIFTGFSKARAIITELISGLNPDVDPELYERLTGLYTFMFTRLVDASSEKSIEIIDEVIELLRYERETWSLLVANLASENAEAATMENLPTVPPAGSPVRSSAPELPGLAPATRISTTG
ncbi:MAG TPA: flagellar export chaperone FliS [Phycisphaerales bacterium]|nr:flagellar export chaperone FliS [Phycisphaerales bacterium]